jgi:N-acetylneuraminic acid mutarotase
MKTKITLFFLLALSLVNAQVPSFATKKSLGKNMCARHSAGMTTLNDKLYIFGGYPTPSVSDFTEYDPATGQIIKLIENPINTTNTSNSRCLFTVQNTIYSLVYSTVLKYSFATNSWTTISMNLGAGIGANPDAGFVIGDIIYFTSATGNNFYSFNTLTNATTQLANYPSEPNRTGAFAFEINGKGYMGSGDVTGGSCTTLACANRRDFYEYDPSTNTWLVKASLPVGFQFGVGISHNGKGYAGLGLNNPSFPTPPYNTGWFEYDPSNDSWTIKQKFLNAPAFNSSQSIWKGAISKIGNDLFVFGGQRGNAYLDEVYKYNTTANTWSLVTNELGQNREAAMGFFSNGKIYIGGGIDN